MVTIANQSSSWQSTLEGVTDGISKDAADLIDNQVTGLVQRSLGGVQTNIACIIDFMGARVIEGLQQIKADLLGQSYSKPPATVCSYVPSEIRLDAPPASIDIYGYNFDSPESVTVELVGKRDTVNLTEQNLLAYQTAYQQKLVLRDVPMDDEAVSIRITGYTGQSATIPIVPKAPRNCATEEHTFSPDPHTFIPPLIAGDAEYWGGGPDISLAFQSESQVVDGKSALVGHLSMTAQESHINPLDGKPVRGDTLASGTDSWTIWQGMDGYRIASFEPAGTNTYGERDVNGWSASLVSMGTATPIRSYWIVGDTYGNDVAQPDGDTTRVQASFNKITVHLVETGACVPA